MAQYQGLVYKTKGSLSPQGRSRIYFCSHRDDFEKSFVSITAEILDLHDDVAIWYHRPENSPNEGERDDFFIDLQEMQLFVVPITGNFLFTENDARLVEFKFALDNHIPVLPLLQEPGLELDFNRICGNLQMLNPFSKDTTEIPYKEKLKLFLNSILVGEELSNQIRDAFDAYIFLSYRKKDRKYANQLMNLIHENHFCRDVAIWYDEFLVPGENFNSAIAKALVKSDLFVLTVTPNLLEKSNYVMTTEYPEAVKTGIPIVPVEMVETDTVTIRKNYTGIQDPVSSHDKESVSRALSIGLKRLCLTEMNSSPKHLFFIGLAYLSGIDMEVNRDRALNLIMKAAEGNLSEAYEKLVSMYTTGEGVERNYVTAAQWQDKYVGMLAKTLTDPLDGRVMLEALQKLGDMWMTLSQLPEANEAFTRALRFAENRLAHMRSKGSTEDFDALRDWALAMFKVGSVRDAEGNLQEAKGLYLEGLRILEDIARRGVSTQAYEDLARNYRKIAGVFAQERNIAEQISYCKKAVDILEECAKSSDSQATRRELSVVLNDLARLCYEEARIPEAKAYCLRSSELREQLLRETETTEAYRAKTVSLDMLGILASEAGQIPEAKKYFQESLDIRERILRETDTVRAHRDKAISLNYLGAVYQDEGNLQLARQYYLQSLGIDQELAEFTRTILDIRSKAITLDHLANVYKAEGDFSESKKYYVDVANTFEEIANRTKTTNARRDYSISLVRVGKLCEQIGQISEAKSYFLKALELREKIVKDTGTALVLRDQAQTLCDIAHLYFRGKDFSNAESYYRQALDIRNRLAEEHPTRSTLKDKSSSLIALGNLYLEMGSLSDAKKLYSDALRIRETFSEGASAYRANRDLVVVLNNLSRVCWLLGDYNEAKGYCLRALSVVDSIVDDNHGEQLPCDRFVVLKNLRDVCLSMREDHEAETISQRLAETASAIQDEVPQSQRTLADS